VLLVSVLLLAASGAVGYTIARNEPRLREEPSATEVPVAEAANVRISKDATLRWEYVYEMCGHIDTAEAPVDKGLAGLTFTQLQEKYPAARIVSFDTGKVVMRLNFACYCPEHYILKKDGDELAIYRTKEGTEEQRVYRLIHLPFNSVEAGERAVLTVGRVFDSLQDAEGYITGVLGDNTP
jgi:hypothetical protein